MTSAKRESTLRCAEVQRFCDAFVDGEFGDVERAELETHLTACVPCEELVREQLAWKRAVKDAAPREQAPDVLRARMRVALDAEPSPGVLAALDALPLAQSEAVPERRSLFTRSLPYAAAASVALMLVVSRGRHAGVTEDVIAKHSRNLPMEVQGRSDEVRRWYADKVDFPVRPPTFGNVRQVALRGGRLANVRERQAAYLLYDMNGNKVSVFIFDPGELPLEARRHTVVGNREVYLDGERGYNVALYRDNGVGYAIASELDQDQMLKLVSAAVTPGN